MTNFATKKWGGPSRPSRPASDGPALLPDMHTVPTVCQSVDWPPEQLPLSTIMY